MPLGLGSSLHESKELQMPTVIEKIENDWKVCKHPEHNPPSHVSIPAGHRMVHTCPRCGDVTIVTSPSYTIDTGYTLNDITDQFCSTDFIGE